MSKIIQKGDSLLNSVAKEVPAQKIRTPEIQDILKDMKKALSKEESGVAIAAPQIGESLRIFIVSGKILKDAEDENAPTPPDLVFINPTIEKSSGAKEEVDEGCLSVRNWFGKVERAVKTTVRAYNQKGEIFERGGSGLLAQIFQHEVDHLNGILFTQKAKELHEMKPHDENKKIG